MATLREPGTFDCLAKLRANPDMPYFLLLATDPLAPRTVKDWAARRIVVRGKADAKAAEAYQCAGAMEAWYQIHKHSLPVAPKALPAWRHFVAGAVVGAALVLAGFALRVLVG
jgi:hypothetical protein